MSQKGGERAYVGRLGKDRSPCIADIRRDRLNVADRGVAVSVLSRAIELDNISHTVVVFGLSRWGA